MRQPASRNEAAGSDRSSTNGEHLLAAWEDRAVQEKPPAEPQKTARGIAATIEAGLKELDR
jgi:hypothetical protein